MTYYVNLRSTSESRTIGIRATAIPVRHAAEDALHRGEDVVFDFSGVGITQSFADELVGAIVLKQGPELLSRIVFKGCSEDVQRILRFVTADRSEQFFQSHRPSSFQNQESFTNATCSA